MSVIYHRPDYIEDLHASTKYKEVERQQSRKAGNYFKAALAMCAIPFLINIVGIFREVPSYIYYFSFGSAALLTLGAISRYGNDLQRHVQRCRNCQYPLAREMQDSQEFYACHKCKTFLRGKNWT